MRALKNLRCLSRGVQANTRRFFHAGGLDISTRSPGGAVINVSTWCLQWSGRLSCKGSGSIEDFNETAEMQARMTQFMSEQASGNISLWAVEDFMRQFMPGMSHSRGMFSLAQLNAVVCHQLWKSAQQPGQRLRAPIHAMPNRVRGMFGVDVLVKHLERARAIETAPKAKRAALKKNIVKIAAAAACIRAFPGSLGSTRTTTTTTATTTSTATADRSKPAESQALPEMGLPVTAIDIAERLITTDPATSDEADAALVAAYGAIVALEAAAMLTGGRFRGSMDPESEFRSNPDANLTPQSRIWRAARVSATILLPKKVLASSKCSGLTEQHDVAALEACLQTVLIGATARLLAAKPPAPAARSSSETDSDIDHPGVAMDRADSISSTYVSGTDESMSLAKQVLSMQPDAGQFALGADVVLASQDPFGVGGAGAPKPGQKASPGRKKKAPSSSDIDVDLVELIGDYEAHARNAIALTYRRGLAMERHLLGTPMSEHLNMPSNSRQAADAVINWLGANEPGNKKHHTPGQATVSAVVGTSTSTTAVSSSATAAVLRLTAAIRKWARGVRAASKAAAQTNLCSGTDPDRKQAAQ